MAGSADRWGMPQGLWRGAGAATLIAIAGCSAEESTDGGSSGKPGIDRAGLLASLGENVILATYREFATAAEGLRTTTQAYADSLADQERAAAQDAWRIAMSVWQRAEVYQVGPAAETDVQGGEGLRAEIYSWPIVNPCRVDQEVVERNYADAAAFAGEAPNVRGLDALEYLLFNDAASHSCDTPQNVLNTGDGWTSLSDADRTRQRAEYAATLGVDLVARATLLVDRWEGGFLQELSRLSSGSTFASEREAMNLVYSALLYLDTEVKDMKLAAPAGLGPLCEPLSCPESRYAFASKEHIRANLVAFQATVDGGGGDGADASAGGIGFGHVLRSVGADALVSDLARDTQAALDALAAIEEDTLDAALSADVDSVVAVHTEVKKVTDNLKSEFAACLDLSSMRAGGSDDD